MKRLFVLDMKNYDESWEHSKRPSVRAIIERDGKLAMVHSLKYDYYSFPGGGIEENESHSQALVREIREETGLNIIEQTISEYGSVLSLQKSTYFENTVFEQENFYYRCETNAEISARKLEDYEIEHNLVLEFVHAEKALIANRLAKESVGADIAAWIPRESRVLEMLIAEGRYR